MAYRMTSNIEEAKEICQESFMRAFKYLRRYDPNKSFKNWLYQISINVTNDFLRKKKKSNVMLYAQGSHPSPEIDPEERHLKKEFKEKILDCVKELSPKEKNIFLLRDIEGFNIKETADILNCSEMSVRFYLSSARKKIRDAFLRIYPEV